MTNFPPVLYRGSVKNVRGEVSAENLLFEFSDRFSIFDWGEMPDTIEEKGKTLAIMGKSFFKHLENPDNWRNLFSSKALKNHFSADYLQAIERSTLFKQYCQKGLPHHAVIDRDDEWNSPLLKVKNIEVLRPPLEGSHYNYEIYQTKPVNTLVPLEIIFRLGLVPGNSLSKRFGDDLNKWKAYGFDSIPEPTLLKTPVIDFSTKLERTDRYVSFLEAQELAGLSVIECAELVEMTHLIALNLFAFHDELEMQLWDGKIELAFIPGDKEKRSFMLVDSIGIDELRLIYKGERFSKEFLREFYKETSWYKNLEKAKKDAITNGGDFKRICIEKYHSAPEYLDSVTKSRAQAVYKSYANEVVKKVTGQSLFEEEFNLENYKKRFL